MARVLCLLTILLSVPASALAQARPRAAVLPLSGRRAGPATRLVRGAIEDHADVVDSEEADPGDQGGRAALAQQLGVDLLVVGSVSGSRRRPRVALTFVDARGEERATETANVPRGGRGRRALRRMMNRAFDAIGPLEPVAPEPEPDPEPIYDTEDPAAADDGDNDDGDSGSSGFSDGQYRPFLRLRVGLSTRNRHLDVAVGAGRDLRHNIDLYPEFLAEAIVRPLAFLGEELLYGVRVRLRFEYALYWESADPMGNVFGGSQWGFSGDAGYLLPIADIVELGGTIGGGTTAYQLDANPFVPSVEYAHLELRAVSRIRAYDELLILHADLGYRYARGSGQLPADFGDMDGNGIVFAGGVSGTILLDSSIGLDYAFELEWQRLWFSFGGMPADTLAMGGSEESVRGRFLVGLSLQ